MPEWKDEILQRLAGLQLSPTREAEIVEELTQHLDDHYAESLAGGATPEEAYRAALVELNEGQLPARELRDSDMKHQPIVIETNRRSFMGDLRQDLRYGIRMLRKNPGRRRSAASDAIHHKNHKNTKDTKNERRFCAFCTFVIFVVNLHRGEANCTLAYRHIINRMADR
jgi:hypothetical protein